MSDAFSSFYNRDKMIAKAIIGSSVEKPEYVKSILHQILNLSCHDREILITHLMPGFMCMHCGILRGANDSICQCWNDE